METRIFVGTAKGLFVFERNGRNWETGIHFRGKSIFAIGSSGKRVFAAPFTEWTGTSVSYSDDMGRTWHTGERPLKFPASAEASLAKIWSISSDMSGKLYFGVEPSALFTSVDNGASWELCEGLWNHPHRAQWEPGYGGLCLHTVLHLSETIWVVATSTGGVYRTEDAGLTWQAANTGILAPFMPEEDQMPEFGQCVHKIAFHRSNPHQLFLQHHWGVYRSDDAGKNWENIGTGKNLRTDFGFVCVSNKPKTAFIIPIHSDEFRCFNNGEMKVFRTEDAGESWLSLEEGLPQENAYDCVLRDSFDSKNDELAFGTTGGGLFYSDENGDSWQTIADRLPRITCVRFF